MVKAEQIPNEAEDGIRRAMHKGGTAKDYIAAALNAWPGMRVRSLHGLLDKNIILPLPPEKETSE